MRNAAAEPLAPNMPDYERARREFSWAAARDLLSGLPFGRGLNIAHEAVDRHALSDKANHVAIRAISEAGARRDITYDELARLSSRFANLLEHLPITTGDRVFVLLPRIPELVVAALGTLKARAIFTPLFAAFGPEPIRARAAIGQPRVLVTNGWLNGPAANAASCNGSRVLPATSVRQGRVPKDRLFIEELADEL